MIAPRMLVAALVLGWSAAGHAASGPICSQPNVIELAARHYSAELAHATLLPKSVAEVSTDANRVVCTVDLSVRRYDASLQPYPQTVIVERSFVAYRLDAGLRVDFGAE